MNAVVEKLLRVVAGLTGAPSGAHNIRVDGKSVKRRGSKNIQITSKMQSDGMDIHIGPGTRGETLHIPVILDQSGLTEKVYNDFYIGPDCDVTIIAGCGIHNGAGHLSRHDGVHTFHVGERSRVKYIEKHYGEGSGKRVMNPVTAVHLAADSRMEMETEQIEGVDSTDRETRAALADRAVLTIHEKLMTSGEQAARTAFEVSLDGEGSGVDVISRSVAKGSSAQTFYAKISGNNACTGHSACDAIIMDHGRVMATPIVVANHAGATLIHEAAIGRIAGEQITKLMTLGLTAEQAEQEIIAGFLR